MHKIAVLISGGGSNLQAIINSVEKGELNCSIEAVISDNENAVGLIRAKDKNISTYVVNKKAYGEKLSDEILNILDGKVDLIVLAGFLSILQGQILKNFKGRIINIHPSLLPEFGGKGMYGLKVHKKVIESGISKSGCTVHFVDEEVDNGDIILQKTVDVYSNDTPESLQQRILQQEHIALPEAIKMVCGGIK